jgi:lysozyme
VEEDDGKQQSRIERAVSLIKSFEGFRETAYRDGDRWSIGYGTISHEGEAITREEAHKRITAEVIRLDTAISRRCGECDTHHIIALVSMAYNVGLGGLLGSDVWAWTLEGEHDKAADGMLLWNKFRGKFNRGLYKRRQKEKEIYLGKGDSDRYKEKGEGDCPVPTREN